MNENYKINRGLTVLINACLLLFSCALITPAEAKSQPAAERTTASNQPQPEAGRLIIRRLPNIGANVIVDLYVDGKPFGSVQYGETFDGSLPTGRHELSVEATPRPSDNTRTSMPIQVQGGETYTFTAEDNGSGKLVLK